MIEGSLHTGGATHACLRPRVFLRVCVEVGEQLTPTGLVFLIRKQQSHTILIEKGGAPAAVVVATYG